ncbi:MAG: PD-(D/E)XK nuclease family protein [Anaerolineae bacterium]|nr:PD-(D/E)XK nuclease family protein [Anaerolineae bacterium]MDW8100472.1 PD-(D/E)XK nuclease family protein [Anaerolineae bacterium]
MALPDGFQFSQASLQDYVECRRRFQLRYLHHLAWPAVEAEPALEYERCLRQGEAFHRLIHQHLLNFPSAQLSSMAADAELGRWWHHYLTGAPADLPDLRYPEVILSAPIYSHRLVAKYDLIAVEPGERMVIVDWKTYRRRPPREWLARRLQTQVYPYLLVLAGFHLNGGQPVQPEQVEMIYWFAEFPQAPERFAYSSTQHRRDGDYLTGLIHEIAGLAEDHFTLTDDRRRCRYCPYRSLCRRGIRADSFDETDYEIRLEDFDLSPELEFITEAVL